MSIETFEVALATVVADNPGIRIEADANRVLVGFWFDTETGNQYCCGIGATFGDAYRQALDVRATRLARSVIEAQVRAEVDARMEKAA